MVKDQGVKMYVEMEYLTLLKDRVNLPQLLFRERGSRLFICQSNGYLTANLDKLRAARESAL